MTPTMRRRLCWPSQFVISGKRCSVENHRSELIFRKHKCSVREINLKKEFMNLKLKQFSGLTRFMKTHIGKAQMSQRSEHLHSKSLTSQQHGSQHQ